MASNERKSLMKEDMLMENDFITRREFEEYQKRLEDKKNGWDDDLAEVKTEVKELRTLTTSVAELAQSVKAMAAELQRQGGRLEAIEKRDGEMWRKFIGYVLTAIITAVVTYFITRLGR